MKKTFFWVMLLALPTYFWGQASTSMPTDEVATFCKVWGFLKYYHPAVATGKTDWDSVFIHRIREIKAFPSPQERSAYYLEWINGLGKVNPCAECSQVLSNRLTYNLDLAWTDDKSIFTAECTDLLDFIEKNRNLKAHYYVQKNVRVGFATFNHEKVYKDSIFPAAPLRLLGLARYWNIIQYFYPYKYQTDQKWDAVLTELVPPFRDASDTTSYHVALYRMSTKLNDSHAGFATRYSSRYFGTRNVPVRVKMVENNLIVTDTVNAALCAANDIRKGDIIRSIDGKSILSIFEEIQPSISASNQSVAMYFAWHRFLAGHTDSVKISFERNGILSEKYIRRYLYKDLKFMPRPESPDLPSYQKLDNNIGYVHMGRLKRKEVKKAMRALRHTQAIIFDVRNYPNGTMYHIAHYLNKFRTPFAKFTTPDLTYPGVFNYSPTIKCGKRNAKYYKGKVVVLFNETTQSHGEFTVMALQTAPNVVCIGSQTSGADGNVTAIMMPGEFKMQITGIGVFYPDGRETQRVGMVPDIIAKPTLKGLREGKDEVLETAIKHILKQ